MSDEYEEAGNHEAGLAWLEFWCRFRELASRFMYRDETDARELGLLDLGGEG
jgi:hypothetical protein